MRQPNAGSERRSPAILLIIALAASAAIMGCDSDQPTYKPSSTKTRSTKSPAKWESSSGSERPQALPHRA